MTKNVFEDDVYNEEYANYEEEIAVKGTRPLHEIYQRCNNVMIEPSSFFEASKHEGWQKAIQEEILMIEKNKTWELVDAPERKKIIGVKWVYRVKINPNGSVKQLKARLVMKGYSQMANIDYTETFAPVARLDTKRLPIALAAQRQWEISHLDVKSTFLNGWLEEEIYVAQPEGFVIEGKERKVYRRNPNDATLYVRQTKGGTVLISLYVDDLLITSSNPKDIEEFKMSIMKEFEMTDLGKIKYFLGLEVSQEMDGIFICQSKYTQEILKKFFMENCKPTATPLVLNAKLRKNDGNKRADETKFRSLVGSLMYLTTTRPDLMYSTSLLSRFMQEPSEKHFSAGKRVLRYLKGTKDQGIWFKRVDEEKLRGYVDSDWAGSVDDMKSITGYYFTLGLGIFYWCSRKQEIVAQSTAEAE
ncbi:uncharacterized mitochondrial protein AtMg00810-like [Mangifera indica]|uniref:uncharacterized mitochondrial protein AtMg00810-like n=1 Tax=Mangifera indica TaxID=29780 RepID=UPI001CFA953E|nr:uncharacterized mitochondrial protein AtMg00810-like [Mangifera indica]